MPVSAITSGTRARHNLLPTGPVTLNRNSPLAAGIVSAIVLNSQRRVVDIAAAFPQTTTAPALISFGKLGTCARDWAGALGESVAADVTGAHTVACALELISFTSANQCSSFFRSRYVSESNNQGWEMGSSTGGKFTFNYFNNNGAANYGLNSNLSRSNGSWFLAHTADASARRLYINGLQDITKGTSLVGASNTLGSGLSNGTGANTEKQFLYAGFVWRRTLSAAEVFALYDPRTRWDLIYPLGRVTYSFPGAAVVGGNRRRRVIMGAAS